MRQYLIPGVGYVNETSSKDYLIPGSIYINETVQTVTTRQPQLTMVGAGA